MTKVNSLSRWGLIALFFVLLAGYALFEARFIILGPQVHISYPADGGSVQSNIILMEGTSKNISWLSLNGRQIFTNGEGFWSEKLIVAKGVSIMRVKASDRFGRETEKTVRFILN